MLRWCAMQCWCAMLHAVQCWCAVLCNVTCAVQCWCAMLHIVKCCMLCNAMLWGCATLQILCNAAHCCMLCNTTMVCRAACHTTQLCNTLMGCDGAQLCNAACHVMQQHCAALHPNATLHHHSSATMQCCDAALPCKPCTAMHCCDTMQCCTPRARPRDGVQE